VYILVIPRKQTADWPGSEKMYSNKRCKELTDEICEQEIVNQTSKPSEHSKGTHHHCHVLPNTTIQYSALVDVIGNHIIHLPEFGPELTIVSKKST